MHQLYEQYTGIVVASKDIDPGHSGAVRVKLLGYTDDLDDADQPWAYPINSVVEKCPKPGTYLDVRCTNGDRAFLRYQQSSGIDGLHSSNFRDGYPNTTVIDNGIVIIYDEVNHILRENDVSSGYDRTVGSDGRTEITAPMGYAYSNRDQVPASPVITSCSVNVCTGKPIGQGSEFYSIPVFKLNTKGEVI